ncbi:MAG: hypothetical protein JXL80_11945, partial [Planctomycetes bacterium]|nr:hypothetical protein [Planctomycetota bacterium]
MDDIRSNRRAVAFVLVAGVAAMAVAATACKSSGADDDAQQIKVDKASQAVVITAAVAEHKEQDADKEKAAAVTLEYLLVADGGNTDKSALVTKVRPEALRKALVS